MEEIRWQHGMEEFRAVQDLVRGGRHQEALDRARKALVDGHLGRRYAARLNSLVCWLYVPVMQEPSPAAVLHGEEAVRLADLLNDEWIRCEALVRLVPAYCQLGDIARAQQSCERLAGELEQNEMVIPGGTPALWLLRALVALAAGDLEQAGRCLDQAEALAGDRVPGFAERIQEHRTMIRALEAPSQTGAAEARRQARMVCLEGDGDLAMTVRGIAMEALLAEPYDGQLAQEHARDALLRAIAIGRADLARLVRKRLAHLL